MGSCHTTITGALQPLKMRILSVSLVSLSLMSAAQGQGFFQNILNTANRFNPFRPRPAPPAPSFNPAPSRPNRPFTSFTSSSSSSSGGGSSGGIVEIPAPSFSQQSQPTGGGGGGGNHVWQGRNYLLSWREGRNSFSWSAARSYCSGRGMRMVSLDSAAKRDHFTQQVAADGSPYFWAGGRLSGDKRSLTWENGRSEGISKGRHPWSFTGSRGAQPDGQGSEHCLAILNNFYNDGVKFHDVGCSHKKPTVCEA